MSLASTRASLATFALLLGLGCGPRGGPDETTDPGDGTSATAASGDELTQICEHNYEILVERVGAGSPAVHDAFIPNCKTNSAARRESLEPAQWAERKQCVLAAEDADALGLCDGRAPKPKPDAVVVSDSDISVTAVCEHIIEIIENELGGASTPLWTPEERADMIKDCAEDGTRERSQDPVGFERQARCLMQATSIETFDRCEEDD